MPQIVPPPDIIHLIMRQEAGQGAKKIVTSKCGVVVTYSSSQSLIEIGMAGADGRVTCPDCKYHPAASS